MDPMSEKALKLAEDLISILEEMPGPLGDFYRALQEARDALNERLSIAMDELENPDEVLRQV